MRRRGRILCITQLLALSLAACTAPAPTPKPNAVVHFRNLSASALYLDITSGDVKIQGFVRPCGGDASYAVPDPTGEDPRVGLVALLDTTGAFDNLVANVPVGTDVLDDVGGHITFSGIVWSRGDIGIADMPVWVTFHAGTTDVSPATFSATAPPRCEPWPASE